jgi:hypothetical protein
VQRENACCADNRIPVKGSNPLVIFRILDQCEEGYLDEPITHCARKIKLQKKNVVGKSHEINMNWESRIMASKWKVEASFRRCLILVHHKSKVKIILTPPLTMETLNIAIYFTGSKFIRFWNLSPAYIFVP